MKKILIFIILFFMFFTFNSIAQADTTIGVLKEDTTSVLEQKENKTGLFLAIGGAVIISCILFIYKKKKISI